MAVVAAHLAVGGVEAGRVGEGRRQRVIVRGRVGVAGRWQQRLGVRLGRRGVVVLVLVHGGPAAVAQGLALGQLVAQSRHPLFLLRGRNSERENCRRGLELQRAS